MRFAHTNCLASKRIVTSLADLIAITNDILCYDAQPLNGKNESTTSIRVEDRMQRRGSAQTFESTEFGNESGSIKLHERAKFLG